MMQLHMSASCNCDKMSQKRDIRITIDTDGFCEECGRRCGTFECRCRKSFRSSSATLTSTPVSAILLSLFLVLGLMTSTVTSLSTNADGKNPFAYAGGGASTPTTPASTTKSSRELPLANERDRFIMSVFEALLSTMDAKLRRVENLDKAVEHLMRKMESLHSRVNRNIEKTEQVLSKLRAFDTKIYNVGNGKVVENLDGRLGSLDEKVNLIDTKLSLLTSPEENKRKGRSSKFSPTQSTPTDEHLKHAASEPEPQTILASPMVDQTVTRSPRNLANNKITDDAVLAVTAVSSQVAEDVVAVKESVSRIEARLGALTGVMWPKLGYLIKSVSEIHEAIIDYGSGVSNSEIVDELDQFSDPFASSINSTTTTTSSTTSTTIPPPFILPTSSKSAKSREIGGGANGNRLPTVSRIDRLITRVDPLATVSQKMDEVWNVVVGTKSSVDDLVPKSEQLLDKTQRQERAISNIHSDLTNMADQIIGNLYEVEKTLKSAGKQSILQSNVKFFQDMKDLPIEAREALLKAGHFIHSDVDSVPLVPIVEPPSVPTGQSKTRHSSTVTSSSSSSSNSASAQNSVAQPGKDSSSGAIQSSNGVDQQQQQQPSVTNLLAGGGRSSPSIVFPSIQKKPVFLGGSNTSIESALRDQAYKAYSCADLYQKGVKTSGVYYVQIRGTTYWYLKVYCNMDVSEGGWTVVHRRDDYGEPRESFNRDWDDYKHGFGDVSKEFWLGNENIFMLTNSDDCVLRVELEDFDGNKRYAEYSTFKLFSEKEQYKLAIGGYEGNAGDALNDPWYGSNFSPFSTYDKDFDRSSLNCASMLKGGWWWRSCGRGLNGLYISDPNDLQARQGIVWFRWRGWDYTLRRASMMIRPKSFLSSESESAESTEDDT